MGGGSEPAGSPHDGAPDGLFPSPISPPPVTGDPGVDEALGDFASAVAEDLDGHGPAAEQLDALLRNRLADVGGA